MIKSYTHTNMRAYDLLAKEYERRIINFSKSEITPQRMCRTLLQLAKSRFRTISSLEVGPGSGNNSLYLQKIGCKTTALDISAQMLNVVKKISPKTKRIRADILTYNLPAKKYELMLCAATIHLFSKPDAKKVLRKLSKGLKDKGVIYVSTTANPKSQEGYFEKEDYPGQVKRYRHKYTEPEFKSLVNSSSLRIVEKFYWKEADRKKKWICLVCEKSE